MNAGSWGRNPRREQRKENEDRDETQSNSAQPIEARRPQHASRSRRYFSVHRTRSRLGAATSRSYQPIASGTSKSAAAVAAPMYSSYRSFEVLDRAVLGVPDARRDFVNQVVIRATPAGPCLHSAESMFSHPHRFQIEGDCRLVQNQNIGLCSISSQNSKRADSPPETQPPVGSSQFFAAEQHLSEQTANLFFRSLGIKLMQPVSRRRALLNQSRVILGEIADSAPRDPTSPCRNQ